MNIKKLKPNFLYIAGIIIIVCLGYFFLPIFETNSVVLEEAKANKPLQTTKNLDNNNSKTIIQQKQEWEQTEINPPQYLIKDWLQGEKVVDVQEKPMVFWYPYCDSCHKVLEESSGQVQYCAVWVKSQDDLVKARQLARQYNINSLYTDEIDHLELDGVPAILYWENEPKVSYGQKTVLKIIKEKVR